MRELDRDSRDRLQTAAAIAQQASGATSPTSERLHAATAMPTVSRCQYANPGQTVLLAVRLRQHLMGSVALRGRMFGQRDARLGSAPPGRCAQASRIQRDSRHHQLYRTAAARVLSAAIISTVYQAAKVISRMVVRPQIEKERDGSGLGHHLDHDVGARPLRTAVRQRHPGRSRDGQRRSPFVTATTV